MELDELKLIWKTSESRFQPKDEAEIASMLKKRSLTIIDKLKRNVWFELIFTLVVSISLLIYALTLPSGAFKWSAISITFTFVVYTVSYVKKIMLLNRFNPANENIRANLTSLSDELTGYLKFYKRSYTILYPLFFILFLIFMGVERGLEKFIEHLARPTTIISLSAIAVLYYFISTRFATWYLNKLYGNHVEKLKGLLHDLHG